MFWGCFGGMSITGLTDLPGDSKSKRKGVTGYILLELALKKILPQILDDYPDFIFMQDDAGIYRWKKIGAWLEEKRYKRIVWLLFSSDLNPIEHV
jgi:hypothetical protein